MKTIYFKALMIICALLSITKASSQCAAGFNYSLNANGNVTFLSTSTSMSLSTTSYTWDYGDSSPITTGSQTAVSHNYANGTYTVTLLIATYLPSYCSDTISQVITVTSSPCNVNLIPSFSYNNSVGDYTFTSTSQNTTAGTAYHWDFGDATTGTGAITTHTYSANNNYAVKLMLADGACNDTIEYVINVNVIPCGLAASFTHSYNSISQYYQFTNTSTGAMASATYTWNFGDGNYGINVTSPSHAYNASGIYTVTLSGRNSYSTCIGTISQTINAIGSPTVPCTLAANFNYNVGTGGNVTYSSTSTNTNNNTTYFWNFGDGNYGYGQTQAHTYITSGNFNVKMVADNQTLAPCLDTIVQGISVTGIPCIADASFSMAPTATAQVWNATIGYPWNIASASWDWGDNTSSNSLFTSHTFSAAGTYSICLTVTATCGSTATACASTSIFRSANTDNMQVIQVHVIPPAGSALGIKTADVESLDWSVFPNPGNGQFDLKINGATNQKVKIKIYDLFGKKLYESEMINNNIDQRIVLSDVSNGIYFIKLNSINKEYTKKIIVNK